jgi:LAO/AO transport system kinase
MPAATRYHFLVRPHRIGRRAELGFPHRCADRRRIFAPSSPPESRRAIVKGASGWDPAGGGSCVSLLHDRPDVGERRPADLPLVSNREVLTGKACLTSSVLLYTDRLNASANLQGWVSALRSGDSRALARAISSVENGAAERSQLLKALFPYSGRARVIGLTGAPGAGKSTLVDHLARVYRKQNKTVGIIAVDPTSPYSGGAILGDRIRMQEHFSDPGIYIRSMATRGSLGGLARTTADVTTVLDASGRDVILIETVGVGQDEVEIVRLADVTVVILVPGMGDDVQSIKAGIMEIADIFVINKSDREGAERVEREIRALQSLAMRQDGWTPPIVKTVASEGTGVAELAAAIAGYEAFLQKENRAMKKSVENWQERLVDMLRDTMLEKARSQLGDGDIRRLAEEVAEHKRDPYSLIEEIAGKHA